MGKNIESLVVTGIVTSANHIFERLNSPVRRGVTGRTGRTPRTGRTEHTGCRKRTEPTGSTGRSPRTSRTVVRLDSSEPIALSY